MPATPANRTPYFPLSVPLSDQVRKRHELPLEPPHPSPAELLYHLRLAGAALPDRYSGGAQLNLLAQLNRVLRELVERFLVERRCDLQSTVPRIGEAPIDLGEEKQVLPTTIKLFPSQEVLSGRSARDYLAGDGRRLAVVELFLLALQNDNPAAAPMRPLFDDKELQQRCRYRQLLTRIDDQLANEPATGRFGPSLNALLREPIEASPHSLEGQLGYVRRHWAGLLSLDLLQSIDSAFAVLTSEQQERGWGPPQAPPVPHYAAAAISEPDAERFSPDTDWMPRTVLIAKTIYVWLDQLSRQYGRPIQRLTDIPDAEIDQLARRGFTALWLIGLWERSPASKQIKRIVGNPEAEASAYSLYDYAVAADLGGEAALAEFDHRCRQRGLRLACDVVPNHTGIYSRWVTEHPDWFVQLDYPPYPGYRFTGPDLSSSADSTIQIEDGYYDHSEAAVVFKHIDRHSGRERYIYHGNDGTHMPWNDTAQLNFLLPEVREAMIQTILHVARTFKVIRFDAAMTLAKKHYQRLWFPRPGGGAGVPSRAEHWMEPEEFERAFPVEFWREVVDRVAAEVPDTLLLAEAFWLMEGFFVRTLGMHRVYNSAFMHMLKNEDNAKYQQLLCNTLEFNPEILKRYVNFMNNPDEATAVEQFGKGDKYFGVAVLLATLPGLPMFGHGQIEGFAEKYGMEYRRAYWDETVDEGFVAHHETQIFPLLHQRYLFSEAELFELYPFETGYGVNHDVFAYSNGCDAQRVLVIYHNRAGDTAGWIRHSVTKARLQADGSRQPSTTTLAAALAVDSGQRHYYRFRDRHNGQEYLRSGSELTEQGLFLQLGAYQYQVFVDFFHLFDEDGYWQRLCERLGGRPVDNLDDEMKRMRYEPLLGALDRLLHQPLLADLSRRLIAGEELDTSETLQLVESFDDFVRVLQQQVAPQGNREVLTSQLTVELRALSELLQPAAAVSEENIRAELRQRLSGTAGRVLPAFLLLHRLGELAGTTGSPARSAAWLDDYLLREHLDQLLDGDAQLLLSVLIRWQELWMDDVSGDWPLAMLFDDPLVRSCLHVHEYDGCQWLCSERLAVLADSLLLMAALDCACRVTQAELDDRLKYLRLQTRRLLDAGQRVGYRLDRLLEYLSLSVPCSEVFE